MEQKAEVSELSRKRSDAGSHRAQDTHRRDDFDQQLDAVVHRFLERIHEPADEDYAMQWAIARYHRTRSRFAKGEDHVATQFAA